MNKKIDLLFWVPLVLAALLTLFVLNQVVNADDYSQSSLVGEAQPHAATATLVDNATETVQLRKENAELKQQVQVLSTEVQKLTLLVTNKKCEIAENYLLFVTIQRELDTAIQKQDWDRIRGVIMLIFGVVHQWSLQ